VPPSQQSTAEDTEKINSDQTDKDENEEDSKIWINNRSVIGTAIINRVKQCPFKVCKKFNAKVDQDNWLICSQCMKQYCFLCGRNVYGKKHFEKKCQRYTPI
jgi:hypothetical protein